jgi:hypothetical protein
MIKVGSLDSRQLCLHEYCRFKGWGMMSIVAGNKERRLNGGARSPSVSGCGSMITSDGQPDRREVEWQVKIHAQGDVITREVRRGGELMRRGCHDWEPERIIWPTWPGTTEDEVAAFGKPLAGVADYWSTAGDRLRDSAKWLAAVLGLALATIVGTSPLSAMKQGKLEIGAIITGSLGLLFLFLTMLLVIQVMRPQSVSFFDVQYAKPRKRRLWQKLLYCKPLYKWHTIVEDEPDLYLPCEVNCLTALRQSMIIELVTLKALSHAMVDTESQHLKQLLCDSQSARAARLLELRVAAATIATVGEYYKLRYRSSWATYGGAVCGLLGTAGVIAAFVWHSAGK